MDLSIIALPVTVAAALIAGLGYFVGARTRARRETLKRAERLIPAAAKSTHRELLSEPEQMPPDDEAIRELGLVSEQIRISLATHHASILRLNDRIQRFRHEPGEVELQQLTDEAAKIIQPTQRLSSEIAHAYDEFRQRAHALHTETV